MEKSELKQIIKEEIKRQLKEIDSKIDMGKPFAVISKGGSIGGNKANYDPRLKGTVIATFDTKKEADAYAQRRNKTLSPGEKKGYGMSYSSVKMK
jgi:hypothetical protein